MDGWDSHIDHDFYVRVYFNCLASKRLLVKRYLTNNPNARVFVVQGTGHRVTITRTDNAYTHTLSVPEHNDVYQNEVSTPSIVCMALTHDNFILVPEDINAEPLF